MENKKSLIALALVALVGVIGGTFAYFTSTSKLTNTFTTGTYSTSVTEEFVSPSNWTPGTTTTKKVNVTNNGSVEVAVRASYTEKWLAADGTILTGFSNYRKVAQFTIGSDWIQATDGYYYYNGTLSTGETSSDFISSVTFNPNFELKEGTDIKCTTSTVDGKTTNSCTSLTTGYAGATYSLDITIETIQADKKWTYTQGQKELPKPTSEEITQMLPATDSGAGAYNIIDQLNEGESTQGIINFRYFSSQSVVETEMLYYRNDRTDVVAYYIFEDSIDYINTTLGISVQEPGWYDENGNKLIDNPVLTEEEMMYMEFGSESYFNKVMSVVD